MDYAAGTPISIPAPLVSATVPSITRWRPLAQSNLPPVTSAAAVEENTHEAWAAFGQMLGAKIHEQEGLTWYGTGIPHPNHNRVLGAVLGPHEADQRIDELMEWFRRLGVPATWLVGPSCLPTDLGSRLLSRGLVHEEDLPGMTLELADFSAAAPLPAGVSTQRVTNEVQLRHWLRPLEAGFDLSPAASHAYFNGFSSMGYGEDSPFSLYLALLDERAAGCTLLFRGSRSVGIYGVATLPEARGRGIAGSLLTAALLDARERGDCVATLHASPMGISVYRRLGFRETCRFSVYGMPMAVPRAHEVGLN